MNKQDAARIIEEMELYEGNWKTYLQMHSAFHGYSDGNKMLIFAQNPSATMVAKFSYWKKMGRHVKKGEKSIRIFAPIIKKDDKGKEELKGFFLVPVFDVSQTEGDPLPEVVHDLSKTSEDVINGIENIIQTPIIYESQSSLPYGDVDENNFVVIPDRGNTELNLQNIIKGYCRYVVRKENLRSKFPESTESDIGKILAESVNFIISKHFGIKHVDYQLEKELLEDNSLLKKISPHIGSMSGKLIRMVQEGLDESLQTA